MPSYQEVHPEEVRQGERSSKEEEEEEEEEVYHIFHHNNLLYTSQSLNFYFILNRRGNGPELKPQTQESSSEREISDKRWMMRPI